MRENVKLENGIISIVTAIVVLLILALFQSTCDGAERILPKNISCSSRYTNDPGVGFTSNIDSTSAGIKQVLDDTGE